MRALNLPRNERRLKYEAFAICEPAEVGDGGMKKKKSQQLPKYIWADCDPDAPASIRWAFYPSRIDQRGNRPDLKAIKLRISLAK